MKAIKVLFIMTILTGIIYPVIITVISQLFFQREANGSLIMKKGIVVGSELIGQKFERPSFFWSRPSAIDYNPLPSGASNLGPTSEKLRTLIEKRKTDFLSANFLENSTKVPLEMLTASASGLDPHISPQAVMLQVNRICKVRNFSSAEKQKLFDIIQKLTERPQLNIFGEERINILLLNLELEKMQ